MREQLRNLNRGSRLLLIGAFVIYVRGLIWRFTAIFVTHPILSELDTDMGSYADMAHRMWFSDSSLSFVHQIYPPGTSFLLGFFLKIDTTGYALMLFQLFLSALLPLLVWFIAKKIYGINVASLALIATSLYAPFVAYPTYFLSEFPTIIAIALCFFFLVQSMTAKKHIALFAALAGLSLGAAHSFKSITYLVAIMTVLALLIKTNAYDQTRRKRILLWSGAMYASCLFLLGVWCTSITGGSFCISSTAGPRAMMDGWYEKAGLIKYHDLDRNLNLAFGNPVKREQGFMKEIDVPFGVYDAKAVRETVTAWIIAHPREALMRPFEHIYELFWGTHVFPFWKEPFKNIVEISQYIFISLVLIPALLSPILHWHRRENKKLFWDFLLIAPIAGIIVTVALTTAEPRYRVPFDIFFIILACETYKLFALYIRQNLSRFKKNT